MARDESNREDLLREATALVERIELRLTDPASAGLVPDDNIVVGFRSNGSASFFFGDDRVYQFNSAGQLRRAYCNGLLFKAIRGRLVSLQRMRQQNEVQLLSGQLTEAEQVEFTNQMRASLGGLTAALNVGRVEEVGQIPAGKPVLQRVRSWLARHDGTSIATTPRAV